MSAATRRALLLLLLVASSVPSVLCQTNAQDASAIRSLMSQWTNYPSTWTSSGDPCDGSWDGIMCSGGRVTSLRLSSVNLQGTLSSSVGQLSQLQFLDLSFNIGLGGPLPSSIGSLSQLTTLILAGCSFNGVVPKELGNLLKMSFLKAMTHADESKNRRPKDDGRDSDPRKRRPQDEAQDNKSRPKRSKGENQYRIERRGSTPPTSWGAKGSRNGGEHTRSGREHSHDVELLPPPPPLPGNVKPPRYALDRTPSPSLSPRGSPGDRASAGAVQALPTPPTTADSKKGVGQAAKLQPGADGSSKSQAVPLDSQDDVLEKQSELAIPAVVTASGETSAMPLPSPDRRMKGSVEPTDNQRPKSPEPSGLSKVDAKYLSNRGQRIKLMLEDSLRRLVKEGPKFPTSLIPTSANQEQHRLELPVDTLTGRFHEMCVRTGLQEIQRLLRQNPLDKAEVLKAIQASTSTWATQNKGQAPPGEDRLVSLLETLAKRLEGKAPPSLFEEEIVTLADKEARPMLVELESVVLSVMDELTLLQKEIPGLEEEIDKQKALQHEQEQEAERLERKAAEARKRVDESHSRQRAVATRLECLRIAYRTFQLQTQKLVQHEEEAKAFLNLFDEQQKKDKAELPEAALVLAYSCNSPNKHDS